MEKRPMCLPTLKKSKKNKKLPIDLKEANVPTNGKKSKKKKKMYEISEVIHLESRAQSEVSHLKPNALSQLVGSH